MVDSQQQDSSHVTAAIALKDNATITDVRFEGNDTIQTTHNHQPQGLIEDDIDWDDSTVEKHVNGFIDAHNQNSDEVTQDEVTATFKKLCTPKKQVNPRYIDADYYEGKTALQSQEYVPDSLYVGREIRSIDGKPIKLDKALDGINYVAFIADAGAGKTTTAKRFTQMVLNKKISSLEHIKLVRYVTIASLNSEEKYNAFSLFFTKGMGSKLSKENRDYGYYWVKKHPHKVLFILDGLDQANWILDGNISEDISYDEPASVPVVFRNVLNRKVFEGCKIVISSREHAIRHIPLNARPERTILLSGLTLEDRVYLILELAGLRGKDILQHLQKNSSNLLSLCETPAFLVFTVAVLHDNSKYFPNTMSEILIQILAKFLKSENQREGSILDILSKLKQLAYNLTRDRRVLFKSQELTSLGLKIDQVHDLCIPTPGISAADDLKIMEGQFNLFFCHQSIQEALTALYICEMAYSEFKKFMKREINESHYRVVRKIILAVLLNPRMKEDVYERVIGTIPERKRKREKLSGWLTVQILGNRNKAEGLNLTNWVKYQFSSVPYVYEDDIELCTLLHECGSDAEKIIEHNSLPAEFLDYIEHFNNLFQIFAVFARDQVITSKMVLCHKFTADVKFITDCLTRCSHVEIETLEIRISSALASLETDTKKTQTARQKMTERHIKVLDLSWNQKMEPAGFRYIGEIIKQCLVDEVWLAGCKLSADKVLQLQNGIQDYRGKIKVLDLYDNYELEPAGFRYIGEIIKQCQVDEVRLRFCKLSADKVLQLQNGIQDYRGKVTYFAFSNDFDSLDELLVKGNSNGWPVY